MTLPFKDREDAGRQLGAELVLRSLGVNAVVLALVRGGVPIGAKVAEALHAPLDIIVVRKLGVPWQPELAMGAIAGETRVLNRQVIRDLRVGERELESVIAAETREMIRRENLYRAGRPAMSVSGRTVILVDDGLATGSTMLAAVRQVRTLNPQRIVVAIPVGTPEACRRLKHEAGECVCLRLPEPFLSVGNWYEDFSQVSDQEVQVLLRDNQPAASC